MASPLCLFVQASSSCPRFLRLAFNKSSKYVSNSPLNRGSQMGNIPFCQANIRCLSTSQGSQSDSSIVVTEKKNVMPDIAPKEVDFYREKYIPITRQSIIRYLMQESELLTYAEQKIFLDFSLALDSAIVYQYNGVLENIKNLFDPINPDKDTVKTREWSRKEKLDNEFWLLQKLEYIMDKANFHELPKATVHKYLREHETGNGIRVSIDPDRYDILRFWALGHEVPEVHPSLLERITNKLLKRPPRRAMEYYKRMVVAIRLKQDSKLLLKAFKEVPMQNIEMLLPDGTVKMSTFDRGFLVTSVSIAALGILAKMVTVLVSLNIDWTLLLTLITGTLSFRVWSTYKSRRNSYLVDVSRTLYFKNIANNHGLLTLLVDRAEDETFKEALLSYIFLMSSRPIELRKKPVDQLFPQHLGGLSSEELESTVEEWIEKKTGVRLEFDSDEALVLLKKLGLVYIKDDKFHVMMLDAAIRILPHSPHSIIGKWAMPTDILEGFDRDEYLETEEEYKKEETKRKKYGWF